MVNVTRDFSLWYSISYLFDSQQQRRPAGLLLSALREGGIDRQPRELCCMEPRAGAGAGAQQETLVASC